MRHEIHASENCAVVVQAPLCKEMKKSHRLTLWLSKEYAAIGRGGNLYERLIHHHLSRHRIRSIVVAPGSRRHLRLVRLSMLGRLR